MAPPTLAPSQRPAANTAVSPLPRGNSSPAALVVLSHANEPVLVTNIEMLLTSIR